jgi:redox-sensitive bicupin YhaK (pirin superfamily)
MHEARGDPLPAAPEVELTTETTAPSPVLQRFPLGMRWPTIDPFLFCVHHDDDYPAGDESLAPAVPVDDRDLGQDFSALEGWSMYHGLTVPGFPGHPHRGFETVTYVRKGLIDHSDSLGAAARFGRGDVQWLTAGKGIVHAEMFPLLDRQARNPLELFQIWLNLPAADKLVDPYFTMFWDGDMPVVRTVDDLGRAAEVTVIAGSLAGAAAPAPPPDSYTARAAADVAIWHLRLDPGASLELPPAAGAETARVLYVFEGDALRVAGVEVGGETGVAVRGDVPLGLTAGPQEVEVLVLQGRPIGEPVAQYGPFVMNTQEEIPPGLRRLPHHRLRRLAVARQRPHPRPRTGPLRPPRRRPHRGGRRQPLTLPVSGPRRSSRARGITIPRCAASSGSSSSRRSGWRGLPSCSSQPHGLPGVGQPAPDRSSRSRGVAAAGLASRSGPSRAAVRAGATGGRSEPRLLTSAVGTGSACSR